MKITYIKENNKIITDSGYFFSKAIFETILIREKAVFLREHIDRLNKALIRIGVNQNIDMDAIENFIFTNQLSFCALKLVVSEKNIIATTREIMYNDKDYQKGFNLLVSRVQRNTTSIFPYIKSTAYMENLIEREKALLDGYNDAMFLNEKNMVSECSTSNIFFVKDKKIFTPVISCGLLNGIIRNWIIKNYKVVEGEFKLDDLLSAQEVFITNSLVGIMSVYKVNNKSYVENMITKKIREDYLKVLEDI